MTAIYSARWVLPIALPPIGNGAVAINGPKIVAVGNAEEVQQRFPGAPITEFGLSAILPGLVNAHTHLELTVMRGFLEREEHDFFAWLRKLTVARMSMTTDDLLVSAMCGAIEAARAGITCVGDSSSVAVQAMKAIGTVGLRGIVFQESFGPDPRLAQENFAKLRTRVEEARGLETEILRAGVSPHAPYTVCAPQLELISQLSIDEKLPLMMHAAESQAEKQFMLDGAGPFAAGLASRGIDWHAPGVSTIEYLTRHGIFDTRPLLAHCVTVNDHDIDLIRNAGAGIAHCPKSNAKLRHGRAPFGKFVAVGLRVGLGSDSVASNNNCDIIEEARFATLLARVTEARPSGRADHANLNQGTTENARHDGRTSDIVTAEETLFAATLGGARAMGLDHQIGAVAEGMQADLTVVGLDGAHQQPTTDPVDTLIFSSSGRDVLMTMVAGKEVYRNGRITMANESDLRQQLVRVRKQLSNLAGQEI